MQTLEPHSTAVDLIARARQLAPTLEAAAARIDAARELPADVVAALHEAELFRMLVPRAYGGFQVDIATFVRVVEILAGADASVAWCVGQSSGCSVGSAYLAPSVAEQIVGPPTTAFAWGPPKGGMAGARAEAVDGGYRLSGTWIFGSGGHHATWFGGMAPVFEADGSPRPDVDGKPLVLQFLFPRGSISTVDTWHVLGLRGTGSDPFSVEDEFVPAERTFGREVSGRLIDEPLYRFSILNFFAVGFAGVALGIARRAVDDFLALASDKRGARSGAPLRENPVVQLEIGRVEAQLRSVRALLFAAIDGTWQHAQAGGVPTIDQRVEMRMASTYAIQSAKDVVEAVHQLAGTNALFEDQPFERRFRDVHAVTQQIQGHLSNFENVGRHLMGLPAGINI